MRSNLFSAANLVICAALLAFGGCCTEDRIVIELRRVDLCRSQDEVVRAEKFIKDFGLEVEDVEFGCRNGTAIDITVTGRKKRRIELYMDEMRRRLALEAELEKAKASD